MKTKKILAVLGFFLLAVFLTGCNQVPEVITPDDSLQKVYLLDQYDGVINMILAEKLALDVYTGLSVAYPEVVEFPKIVDAKQNHIDKLLNIIYNHTDITSDPTVGLEYPDKYQTLLDGLNIITEEDALNAGITIETLISADYTFYKAKVEGQDDYQFLYMAYTNLLASSQDHLAVFTSLLNEL